MTEPQFNQLKSEYNKIIIAIDGHSSCGKSTIAKDLAKALKFLYIDTGAMYRAVTLSLIQNDIALGDFIKIGKLVEDLDLEFKRINQHQELFMNGVNVEKQIRTPEIADLVSPVSEISIIRKKLVDLQRKMAEGDLGVILEGRDIGTVVFPSADLKLFVTADLERRADRRFRELRYKKMEIPIEAVIKNLSDRDRIDSSRDDSPLMMAEDAILVDTTEHSRESQLELVKSLALEVINDKNNQNADFNKG